MAGVCMDRVVGSCGAGRRMRGQDEWQRRCVHVGCRTIAGAADNAGCGAAAVLTALKTGGLT